MADEWCPTCEAPTTIEEETVETAGFEEQARDFHVLRLGCGHELSRPVQQRGPRHGRIRD